MINAYGFADLNGMKRMKIDYKLLEKEYMTQNISLCALAKKHGYALSPVYRYANKHGWDSIKAKRGEERVKREIEREDSSQEKAWEELKDTMRVALAEEWKKLLADKEQHLSAVASLTRATKDAREMGVFGVTTGEKKSLRELEALEKQIAALDSDQGVTFTIEGGDDYAG